MYFRVNTTKATYKPIFLKDFSNTIGENALQKIRVELNQFPKATRVYAKNKVQIKYKAIQKTFYKKLANKPLSNY